MGELPEREPLVIAWPLKEDENPEDWAVMIRADLEICSLLISSLNAAAVAFRKNGQTASMTCAVAISHDLMVQFEKLGGHQAAAQIALKKLKARGEQS